MKVNKTSCWLLVRICYTTNNYMFLRFLICMCIYIYIYIFIKPYLVCHSFKFL